MDRNKRYEKTSQRLFRPVIYNVPQGASRLEEGRVAGYPADRLVLRRKAPCEPIVRPANFPA